MNDLLTAICIVGTIAALSWDCWLIALGFVLCLGMLAKERLNK